MRNSTTSGGILRKKILTLVAILISTGAGAHRGSSGLDGLQLANNEAVVYGYNDDANKNSSSDDD